MWEDTYFFTYILDTDIKIDFLNIYSQKSRMEMNNNLNLAVIANTPCEGSEKGKSQTK